jgi:hypothetical protein
MLAPSFGYSIFCDDIRQEVHGKLSFIGIYVGTMIVHVPFPTTLPKFYIYANYCQPYEGNSPKINSMDFQVWLPGNVSDAPSISAPVFRSDQQQLPPPPDQLPIWDDSDVETVLRFAVPIWLEPLVIPVAGRIKVRAVVDGTVTKLGALKVQPAP